VLNGVEPGDKAWPTPCSFRRPPKRSEVVIQALVDFALNNKLLVLAFGMLILIWV